MKNWKRFLALLLSGAMALSLFACGGVGADPTDSPFYGDTTSGESSPPDDNLSPDPSPDASPEIDVDLSQGPLEFSAGVSPTDTMLTVNGTEVHADLFLYMLALNCMNMQSYLSYFGMSLADMADTLREESASMAVYHTVLRQKAAELGCLLTDDQNADIQAAMAEAGWESSAPYWGLTHEGAEFIFAMNTYYDNVLNAATHAPSDQELADYIDGLGAYRVKHILLKTVDDDRNPLSEDEIARKKTQAEDLLAQLQGAADLPALFDELMMAHSEDHPENNPDGYLATPGDMVSAFEEASLALKEGEMSGIVESEYGYHIILRCPLSDEDKGEYRENYRYAALEEIIAQWVDEAEITRSDALNNLDVTSFYERLAAYQNALAAQEAGEDGVG